MTHEGPSLKAQKEAAAIFGAGCHGTGNVSNYGIAWVTVTAEPAPQYASYVVTIDSITLTRSDNTVYTAVATPEVVDLTQIHNFAELWSSGAIPNGTYIAATITLDYTDAVIVLRDGNTQVTCVPSTTKASGDCAILDPKYGTTPTTYSLTVEFDPLTQPNITPTYASTSAALMAVDIDLPASGYIDYSTSPATMYVRPYSLFSIHVPYFSQILPSSSDTSGKLSWYLALNLSCRATLSLLTPITCALSLPKSDS